MTDRFTACPGCGAPLTFSSAATLVVTCGSCGGASYRSDVDLAFLGKVAEVAPIASPLELGASGKVAGKGWTCLGQVQLDHGAGPWNEWALLLDDGTWAWYAEAQGETLLTAAVPDAAAAAPPWDDVAPGTGVEVAGRSLVVAEVGEARVVTVRGEVPAARLPGTKYRYADLRGADAVFATLDYGQAPRCEAVYVGRTVRPEELGLDPTKAPEVERRVEARRLACPRCAGVVELRDPGSQRVVCASCGGLLDATERIAHVLGVGAALKAKPELPLGARGRLADTDVQLIAYLVRSVTVDGTRYPWREYLLRTTRGAYRWLVEWRHHWAILDPVNPAELGRTAIGPSLRGKSFRHFQQGTARVDHVQGEVYWQVEVGETVTSDDFVAPPFLLTVETSGKEKNVTAGRYVDRAEVEAAFGVRLPEAQGVAPSQPNPYDGQTGRWWKLAGLYLLAILASFFVVGGVRGHEHVGVFFPGLFVIGGLLLPPIVVSSRRTSFEVQRWDESDHPMRAATED